MRFACVHAEKANHAVRRLCRVLEVTPSGYYAWVQRQPSQRQRDNDRLKVRIRAVHAASRGTYGSPRVHEQLTQEGCEVGRERVARLLREMGLVGLPAKRFRHTTDSTHARPVAPNVLARRFHAERPNQRWTTDITYIWTWEGWPVSGGRARPVVASGRRVGRAAAPADGTGAGGAADGAWATRCCRWPGAPFRPRLPVCRRSLSASVARSCHRLLDESQGRLLGQCRH